MYKRKSKPDLMFMLTVFVCLGVLVTSTLNAAESQGWGLAISDENDCQPGLSEWQACSSWHAKGQSAEQAPRRAALHFYNEQRPALGVVWYYSQQQAVNTSYINELNSSVVAAAELPGRQENTFGLALRQQYQQFGFSVSLESEKALFVDDSARLYFGISNRW